MNVGAWIRLVIWIVIALLLIGTLGALFLYHDRLPTVDTDNWSFGFTSHTYHNAELYTVGSTELDETVRDIDIEWIRGAVEIVAYEGDTLRLTEHEPSDSTQFQLHWMVKNGTLYVQPCESMVFVGMTKWKSTRLTVEIPVSWLETLNNVSIDVTSASVTVQDIVAKSLNVEAVSGQTSISDTTVATVDIESVSGAVVTERLVAAAISADTTSGEVRLSGSFDHVETDTVSGDADVFTSNTPSTVEMDSTSGDISITCPEGKGFIIKLDTVSGGFDCDHPITKRGEIRICGDGEGEFKFDTVSGDIHIYELNTVG